MLLDKGFDLQTADEVIGRKALITWMGMTPPSIVSDTLKTGILIACKKRKAASWSSLFTG